MLLYIDFMMVREDQEAAICKAASDLIEQEDLAPRVNYLAKYALEYLSRQ